MSIVIASVVFVAVILFLVGLSLETLRQVSRQDGPLDLLEGHDEIPALATERIRSK